MTVASANCFRRLVKTLNKYYCTERGFQKPSLLAKETLSRKQYAESGFVLSIN